MAKLNTTLLPQGEALPYDLLLLADPSREMINTYISNSRIYLAKHHGETVGVCAVLPKQNAVAEIKNIAIEEARQRRGFGKTFLTDVMKQEKELGAKTLQIATGNSSIHQLNLYKSLGFIEVRQISNFFTDNYPKPIYENGILCEHLIELETAL